MSNTGPRGVSDTNAKEEFSFTLPPRRCLHFLFILRIRATVQEARAHAEMPPLWDAGVNGKGTCRKKDAMHSDKANLNTKLPNLEILNPLDIFDNDMKM